MVSIRVEGVVFLFVFVLAWVGGFVFEHFDEFVEGGGEEGAEDWTDPIYPVVGVERVVDDGWGDTSGWIEGAASEEDAG